MGSQLIELYTVLYSLFHDLNTFLSWFLIRDCGNVNSPKKHVPSGTKISCKKKIRKGNFQMCLSLSFYNYRIVFKVRISSPLQVDGSIRKETRTRRPRIQFESFPCETLHCKLCPCAFILYTSLNYITAKYSK